ncbi:ADP-glucose pyrophosphorylase large subunit [Raphidocelis subcapitata]|uniref:glucose-1-phosphate adenylyltransferase n=1 Tax=Raphidocelis subcapitata TaxID=307507 RepID=A0A2V0P6F7_9CHLO|nr:ADP-glucose pyrophosphorylase large subunit [Raphidocelis subcapitata]|eukprot:GBF92767.1 ADP-glucose pyrophosphorylase large subunit [Raphidocelis subcapitata]
MAGAAGRMPPLGRTLGQSQHRGSSRPPSTPTPRPFSAAYVTTARRPAPPLLPQQQPADARPRLQQPQPQPLPQPQRAPPTAAPAPAAAPAAAAAPSPAARPPFKSSSEVVVMILGGGPGSELRPLTETRAEPAMPFAGLYRLIDVPLSNCINSGLYHVYVLAQFNSTSLNRHLARAYAFVNGNLFTSSHDGFVECLNATQRPGHVTADAWFAGTADAVRHYTEYLSSEKHAAAEDVLVLSGDQIYHMDFGALIDYHRAAGADVTVASTPADEDHAEHLGILKVDERMNVEWFEEKPPTATLHTMSMDTHCYGLCTVDAEERPYVASMGIYVFKKQVLLDLLERDFPAAADFSRDILPAIIGHRSVVAYPHTSYWEDVGTLKNYYRSHMALARGTLRLQLFDKAHPIYTEPRTLPPTKMTGSTIEDCLVGDGCRVQGSVLRGCVLGPCTYVDAGCDLQDSILFGCDEFELAAERTAELAAGEVPLGVGAGSVVRRAIIDKNVRIGRGVRLVNARGLKEAREGDGLPKGVEIRGGILVVKRNAVIPDGTMV